MSLAINIDTVSDVLLADGRHRVEFAHGKSTFVIAASEDLEHRGDGKERISHVGAGTVAGVPSTGAQWLEGESGKSCVVTCPFTSILAVKRLIPNAKL